MRHLISTFLAVVLSFAAASAFPRDADVFVIDRAGTIVGIGTTVAGEVFELELMAGFGGFAELTIVTHDREVVVHDVVVMGGVVFLELVDIALMAREAGFGAVRVSVVDLIAEEAEGGRRDGGFGNAADAGHTSAGGWPDDRADLGSGNEPEEPGRPDEAPETPRQPPVRPEPPVEPPVRPERPDRPEPPVGSPEPPVEPVVPPVRPDPPVEPPEPPVEPPVEPVVPPERPDPPVEPPERPERPDRPEPPVEPPERPERPVEPPEPPVEPVVPPERPDPPVGPPERPERPDRPEPPVEPPGRPVDPPVVSIDPPVDPVEGPALPERENEGEATEED